VAARLLSISRVIDASPEAIFELLADPAMHGAFDGSGTVRGRRGGGDRLTLGSTFGMDMQLGPIRYPMTSTVVEYEENRLIAWRHFGGHRWRYRLEPVDGGTRLTEEFDWSTSVFPKGIELAGYPKRHVGDIERTLQRIAELVESPPG
jgi:uncharacterized protein YndB with AHSA1/START domain